MNERRQSMKHVAIWLGIVVASITVLGAVASATMRLLDVPTRGEINRLRDARKVEVDGKINAIESRHQEHEKSLHEIERKVDVIQTNVDWIRDALRDAGYRAKDKR